MGKARAVRLVSNDTNHRRISGGRGGRIDPARSCDDGKTAVQDQTPRGYSSERAPTEPFGVI